MKLSRGTYWRLLVELVLINVLLIAEAIMVFVSVGGGGYTIHFWLFLEMLPAPVAGLLMVLIGIRRTR